MLHVEDDDVALRSIQNMPDCRGHEFVDPETDLESGPVEQVTKSGMSHRKAPVDCCRLKTIAPDFRTIAISRKAPRSRSGSLLTTTRSARNPARTIPHTAPRP